MKVQDFKKRQSNDEFDIVNAVESRSNPASKRQNRLKKECYGGEAKLPQTSLNKTHKATTIKPRIITKDDILPLPDILK